MQEINVRLYADHCVSVNNLSQHHQELTLLTIKN